MIGIVSPAYFVCDLNYINKDGVPNIFEFEIGSNKSIIRDLKLESQIFSDQSSIIAISAQSNAGRLGLDNSTNVSYNLGITDRMIPKKDSPITNGSDNGSQITNFISSLSLVCNKFFKPLYQTPETDINNFDASQASMYSNSLREVILFFNSVFNTDSKEKAIIPTLISLTLDGTSGFVIGNLFKVKQEFIPNYYKKSNGSLGYLITKIGQSIQDNSWTTTIQGYPFNINSSTIVADDENLDFELIINYKTNVIGNTSDNIQVQTNLFINPSQVVKDRITPILDKSTDSLGLKKLIELQSTLEGFKPNNRNFRNNNPGNISKGAVESIKYKGNNDKDDRFASFSNLEGGVNATIEYIKRIARGGHDVYGKNPTLSTYIFHYAPPNENDTERYLSYVVNGLNKAGIKASANSLLSEIIK